MSVSGKGDVVPDMIHMNQVKKPPTKDGGSGFGIRDTSHGTNDSNIIDDVDMVETPSLVMPFVYRKPSTEEVKKRKIDEKDGSEQDRYSSLAFFQSTLGKFLIDLGVNKVEEANSGPDLRKCQFCSFTTESLIVMEHHLETPHERGYKSKLPQDAVVHKEEQHAAKGKIEKPPFFECDLCPFGDNSMKKLKKHKIICDKRFKLETNLAPECIWDAPVKMRPPPRRPSVNHQMSPLMSKLLQPQLPNDKMKRSDLASKNTDKNLETGKQEEWIGKAPQKMTLKKEIPLMKGQTKLTSFFRV